MINDLQRFKPILDSEHISIDGSDKDKFYQYFEKSLKAAHKKSKDDWSLQIEPADWLTDKSADVYDFYSGKNNQPVLSVVMEELKVGLWLEVLK